jgi:transcriptional regulator with XRE-family HTH domain
MQDVVFDYRKLRGKIKEVCGNQEDFAKAIGVGRVSLSQSLNNSRDFSQAEINKACHVLGIPLNDIHDYFFTEIVQKSEPTT